jgi:carboxyl-terminal processing protease
MKRLILDLRNNGGGSVEVAARVAGEFLPRGAIVYTAEYRKKPEGARDTARVGRSFWSHEKRYPLVVLSNGGTASASELVAGALQDHDRALIVGRPSFGKALLMQGLPLSDGSTMWLVVGHLRTPCGRIIQRQYRGITRREYFRLSQAARDTAGRPSCRSAGGRTLYGGGGIYPDVELPEADPAPLWLARLREADLPLKWVGGYVASAGSALSNLDTLVARRSLSPDALTGFRSLAAAEGVEVPVDGDSLLQRELVRAVALAKFGQEGFYRIVAVTDPQVAAAEMQFAHAAAVLNTLKEP